MLITSDTPLAWVAKIASSWAFSRWYRAIHPMSPPSTADAAMDSSAASLATSAPGAPASATSF